FFFQAEDGIRDRNVTGVQTCALPILYKGMKAAAKEAFGNDSLTGRKIAVQGVGNVAYTLCGHLHKEGAKLVVTDINKKLFNALRSEERRVGKERRCRGA